MPSERKTSQDPEGMLSCDICQKEIPFSEAINVEAQEYVLYFCGTACYATWSKRAVDEFKGTNMVYAEDNDEKAPLVRLVWRGKETVDLLPHLLEEAEQVELTLPASYNHSLFRTFYPDAPASEPEKLFVNGGPEMLHEIAGINGLEELDALAKPLRNSGATVSLISPPTLVITLPTVKSPHT